MFLMTLRTTARTDYEVHQHLHHLFDVEKRCFLWRWAGPSEVNVLSSQRPIQTVPHAALPLDRLVVGRPLAFAMRFVAARCKPREGRHGAKVPLRGMAERRDWLKDKLAAAGAELLFAELSDVTIDAGDGLRIVGAEATGMLRIDDRARFAAHMQAGFGRNRAFGCGLLWLPEIMA